MSSINEELPPPPKPRVSPLDFRNTDLVSRLLAATPPYLYNMPLVPNSYFFSEMLRSLVQSKTDSSSRIAPPPTPHSRRTRKRTWTQARSSDYYQKMPSKNDKQEANWPKSSFDSRPLEHPLELTTARIPSSTKVSNTDNKLDIDQHKVENHSFLTETPEKPPEISNTNMQLMFPNMPPNLNQDSNLLLPPPPPMWYPPLYPTPYGIDPLHFFIDLRVSGHIYDRKNQKDCLSSPQPPRLPTQDQTIEESSQNSFPIIGPMNEGFKQSRHASAFSVPISSGLKNLPINLSNSREVESKNTKFDVKSMGFDKNYAKTSTNYVMSNIGNIYKNLQQGPYKNENIDVETTIVEPKEVAEEAREETEEEREKRVKDLRALIGLELVVDYMNHVKPGQVSRSPGESSKDLELKSTSETEVMSENNETSAY